MAKKETILAIVAHNDDHIIGAGGTLAKYAKEGKLVKTIVFSYGEASHPHLRPEFIIKKRCKEALESDKIIGGKGIVFLGLKEGQFTKQYRKKRVKEKISRLIKKLKPAKIFTLSPGDIHPDHHAVARIVQELIADKTITCDTYSFEVWTPVRLAKRGAPKLAVDITDTYATKVKALSAHKSQFRHIAPFMTFFRIKIWLNAIINGWKNKCKRAEVFAKLN